MKPTYVFAYIVCSVVLIAAILISSTKASYTSPQISLEATRLMTEHMQLHDRIDKNMMGNQKMIERIITILEQIMEK